MSGLSWCPLSEQFKDPLNPPRPVKAAAFSSKPEAEATVCRQKLADIYEKHGVRGIIKVLGYDVSTEISEYLAFYNRHNKPRHSSHLGIFDISRDDMLVFALLATVVFVIVRS